MGELLEVALKCIARGWHVFPCWPKTKRPMTQHGWHDASADEEQIRAWWAKTPNANVAIACNPSNLAVLDIDHGLGSVEDLELWLQKADLYATRAVRTGRRPDYGVQLYYEGAIPDVGMWKLDGCEGQVKSLGGYVMAAGSIHPDSGEAYAVLWDEPWVGVNPTPDGLRTLKSEKTSSAVDDGAPITGNRNNTLTSIAGKLRNAGLSAAALEVALIQVNADRCVPPLGESEVQRIAANAAKWEMPQDAPQALIGGNVGEPEPQGPQETVDWRTRYLTFENVRDAKPTEFLIEGFLALGSITALAAPVAQRKTLIALNVAHALCTGEPLFGYFRVKQIPERIVYLCPEMGLSSFSTRLKQLGLAPYVGTTLFCQTMDEDRIDLVDLNDELPGAVVIIDTLTRFVTGDQNSSDAMSKFADVIFRLKRGGATVLLLHHSVKGASSSLTLDSAMRGSTELAAFVTSCWATKLLDPDDPYKSPSLLVNVKQRDFESKPFKVTADESCRMTLIGEPGAITVLKTKADEEAFAKVTEILRDNPSMGIQRLRAKLKEHGIRKGQEVVTRLRAEVLKRGVVVSE
jgi:Bifunctional DNA primase/polymerase, N-terminal/AAA domain/Primase C terminal 1 (PriCT-1)